MVGSLIIVTLVFTEEFLDEYNRVQKLETKKTLSVRKARTTAKQNIQAETINRSILMTLEVQDSLLNNLTYVEYLGKRYKWRTVTNRYLSHYSFIELFTINGEDL